MTASPGDRLRDGAGGDHRRDATSARAGVGLVLLYLAVAVVTQRLQPHGFRPLFDGFAPPPPYRWVAPSPELAAGNQPPAAVEREVALGETGSEVTNATTEDGQAMVQLEAGSVPPNPPDTAVRLSISPVDPSTLGPLPAGLRPVSNAYRVSLVYQPSQTPVAQLATPGTIALTASLPGDRLLFFPDGSGWQDVASRAYGHSGGRSSSLEATGYYLVAGQAPPAATADPGRRWGALSDVLLFLVATVPIAGAILVLRPPRPLPAGSARNRASSGRGRPRPGRTSQRPPPRRRRKKGR